MQCSYERNSPPQPPASAPESISICRQLSACRGAEERRVDVRHGGQTVVADQRADQVVEYR